MVSTRRLTAAAAGMAAFVVMVVSASGGLAATIPTVTGFSPTSGPVGTPVVLTGTGFTGTTNVRFDGTKATFSVDSDSQITATVPTGAARGTIRITTPGGPVVTSSKFTVTAPGVPAITGFSPASGRVQTTVVITGSGFTDGTTVQFNGIDAWVVIVDSDAQIRATVPVGATSGKIRVANSRGEVLTTSKFTVLKPTITDVEPYGNPGWYEIDGSSLTGVTSVTIAGVPAHIVSASDTDIIVQATGRTKGKVVVTTPGGTAKSSTGIQLVWFVAIGSDAVGYRYNGALAGKPGDQLQIIGAFPGVTSVRFNGRPATITGVTSLGWADVVTVAVPVDATSGLITITDATGTHTLPVSFTLAA